MMTAKILKIRIFFAQMHRGLLYGHAQRQLSLVKEADQS